MSAAHRPVWLLRVAALLALLVALGGLAAAPADAHTGLLGSTPGDGSTVRRAPTSLVLRFADPVVPGTAVGSLTGPEGPIPLREPTVRGATVRMRLAAQAPAGRYTLTWRVVAEDGHPVSGTLSFRVTPVTAPVSSAKPSAASPSPSLSPTHSPAVAVGPSSPPGEDALAVVEAADASRSAAGGSAPTTGGPVLAWSLVTGLLLLGAGGPAVLVRRRRRAAPVEPS
ncbi:copper resistance CopC family protein [Phycicoccus sonneratiae]|uniref:Copper resistance protein CopC n=1 Tax=Phycicoccus sonneratiae TaxID=2807628 RepID=A0ABS2CGC8_9MICO|nr:copper resistance CopC family protein [Phycicoccus sonneraticus]MBM6398926.1 copper resistance protein CopC [Phycicoccus sonneraticus]